MAGLSKSAVIKLILKYIGGSPLMQVPTTTIGGFPVAAQAGGLAGSLAGAASAVSSAVSAAQDATAGLSLLSNNPLEGVISTASAKLDSLTSAGFAGLAAAVPGVSGDPALSAQYDKLKLALGGADGLSGAMAQIKKFKEHTDRLSGLIPSSDSSG